MEGQTPPPPFENGSKNYLTSIPSDKGPEAENPRCLGLQAIFDIFSIYFFFENDELLKLLIINAFTGTLQSGIEDKISDYKALGYAFKSRYCLLFIFLARKILSEGGRLSLMRKRCRHLIHKLVNFQFYIKRIFDILPIFCASSSLSKIRFFCFYRYLYRILYLWYFLESYNKLWNVWNSNWRFLWWLFYRPVWQKNRDLYYDHVVRDDSFCSGLQS